MNVDTTFVVVQDTLVSKHEVYEYRIRPYDWLGNTGEMTEPVRTNTFTSHDFPYLRRFTTRPLEDRKVELKWVIENRPFLRSIKIMRSMEFDSAFIEVAEVSPFDSAYVDVLPVSMENYYYRLILNGPDEVSIPTSATSGMYQSKEAPAAPDDIIARTIKGGVALFWSDRQNNVFGYKVYRGSDAGDFQLVGETVPFTASRKFHYQDTSSVLQGHQTYAYAIKTISDSYVESPFSDTVFARPDIPINLLTPVKLKARKMGNNVLLVWEDLTVRDSNVAGYRVHRKTSNEPDFKPLTDEILPSYTNHFTDTAIEKGYIYQYIVKACSRYGDESKSSAVVEAAFYIPLPAPPHAVTAYAVRDGVQLSWDEVMDKSLANYVIYKQHPGSEMTRLGEVPRDRNHFTDSTAVKGELSFYYVASKNESEVEGPKSEAITVRY
jgi:fibronectin type 3 domain-containing protein